jgi:hypothetical protein
MKNQTMKIIRDLELIRLSSEMFKGAVDGYKYGFCKDPKFDPRNCFSRN